MASFADVLCFLPGLGQAHGRLGVDQAIAVVVGKMQPAAVPVAGVVPEPCRSVSLGRLLVRTGRWRARVRRGTDGRADVPGGIGQKSSGNVAPAEVRVRLQHQRDHARDLRRGGRRAAERSSCSCRRCSPARPVRSVVTTARRTRQVVGGRRDQHACARRTRCCRPIRPIGSPRPRSCTWTWSIVVGGGSLRASRCSRVPRLLPADLT